VAETAGSYSASKRLLAVYDLWRIGFVLLYRMTLLCAYADGWTWLSWQHVGRVSDVGNITRASLYPCLMTLLQPVGNEFHHVVCYILLASEFAPRDREKPSRQAACGPDITAAGRQAATVSVCCANDIALL